MLARGSGIDLDDLAQRSVVVLPEPEPGTFFDRQVHTADGRVDCCPDVFADALQRCRHLFDELVTLGDDGGLLLIHGRDRWMHNSWMANVGRVNREGRPGNPLCIHPDDAAQRGLGAGDAVVVRSEHGEVEAEVHLDDTLLPGVVWMVHGGGHRSSPRLRVAAARPGVNPNVLLPVGEGSYEPLSSQAHMTGIPVRIHRPAMSS